MWRVQYFYFFCIVINTWSNLNAVMSTQQAEQIYHQEYILKKNGLGRLFNALIDLAQPIKVEKLIKRRPRPEPIKDVSGINKANATTLINELNLLKTSNPMNCPIVQKKSTPASHSRQLQQQSKTIQKIYDIIYDVSCQLQYIGFGSFKQPLWKPDAQQFIADATELIKLFTPTDPETSTDQRSFDFKKIVYDAKNQYLEKIIAHLLKIIHDRRIEIYLHRRTLPAHNSLNLSEVQTLEKALHDVQEYIKSKTKITKYFRSTSSIAQELYDTVKNTSLNFLSPSFAPAYQSIWMPIAQNAALDYIEKAIGIIKIFAPHLKKQPRQPR